MQFSIVLAKVKSVTSGPQPTSIFEVNSLERSIPEDKFQKHARDHSTLFAFHGSHIDSFHSILNYGLQQHLSKTALFGDGIYLSSEMHVSQAFSPIGAGWDASRCGKEMSCIAICEFVNHPQHLKCQTKGKSCKNDPTYQQSDKKI